MTLTPLPFKDTRSFLGMHWLIIDQNHIVSPSPSVLEASVFDWLALTLSSTATSAELSHHPCPPFLRLWHEPPETMADLCYQGPLCVPGWASAALYVWPSTLRACGMWIQHTASIHVEKLYLDREIRRCFASYTQWVCFTQAEFNATVDSGYPSGHRYTCLLGSDEVALFIFLW